MKKIMTILLLSLSSLWVQAEPVSKSYWGDKAIGSHDAVAYHQATVRESHSEVIGSKGFTVKYKGANWFFASKSSADKFSKDPEKYIPLYNGFCANALSLREGLIPTSGKIWEFFGDELHLFYAERGRQRWLKGDWQQYQKVADQAWHTLKLKQ